MIHLYKLNGYNIVMDVNSGAIHEVDDETYQVLEFLRNELNDAEGLLPQDDAQRAELVSRVKQYFSRELYTDIDDIMEDIFELSDSGQLFSEDVFMPMAEELKGRNSVLKAMCLHVAHACNMDCEYCFAGKGEYHGTAGLMSFETGKAAIDYLVANSPGRTNLEVDFFGGEPLLNWDVVKQLVSYGRSIEKEAGKNFRFTITTNGRLIDDEVIEFCNREMSNVVISLDGRKETNDRMRRTKDGAGTYDLIIDKFKKFVEAREGEYYMRGTYTHNNLEFTKDLCHMADLGFKELSIEPVVAPSDAPYALHEEDADVLCEQYELLALEMIKRRNDGNGFSFYHYSIDLEGGPCIAKRISGCGVGTEYMAVTPEGDIYPCHQFVGEKDFIMGNIFSGITRPEVRELFTGCNVYSHEECRDCFARLYCSGGCAANAYHSTGSVTGVYELGCKLHRKRIECAIMMKVDENA
jgi:uncharacterized protein